MPARRRRWSPGVAAALAWLLLVTPAAAEQFDLVIANGRLMDPESGLDAIRHVGLRGGVIGAVSSVPRPAARRSMRRVSWSPRGTSICTGTARARTAAGTRPWTA